MRMAWNIILFYFCFSLAIGIVSTYAFPLSAYVDPEVGNAEDFTQKLNATDLVEQMPNPAYSIPIVGEVYYGVSKFFEIVWFVIDGVPNLLRSLGVPNEITYGINALNIFMLCTVIIQLITGRFGEG